MDIAKDQGVKLKPGHILHVVNKLYPYTIEFVRGSGQSDSRDQQKKGASKRPHEDSQNKSIETKCSKMQSIDVLDINKSADDTSSEQQQHSSQVPFFHKTSLYCYSGTIIVIYFALCAFFSSNLCLFLNIVLYFFFPLCSLQWDTGVKG